MLSCYAVYNYLNSGGLNPTKYVSGDVLVVINCMQILCFVGNYKMGPRVCFMIVQMERTYTILSQLGELYKCNVIYLHIRLI